MSAGNVVSSQPCRGRRVRTHSRDDTVRPRAATATVEARNGSRDVGRIERTRLERRLEKLIALHFSPPGSQPKREAAADPRPAQQSRRASSIWDLDLSDLKNKSAGDLWREVVQSQASQSGKNDIRGASFRLGPCSKFHGRL